MLTTKLLVGMTTGVLDGFEVAGGVEVDCFREDVQAAKIARDIIRKAIRTFRDVLTNKSYHVFEPPPLRHKVRSG